MIYCIPSRNRDVMTVNTFGLHKGDGFIFVDSVEQRDLYKNNGWNHGLAVIVTGKTGISATRNYILEYAGGQDVVMLDDDLRGVYRLNSSETGLVPMSIQNINDFCNDAFKVCRKAGTKLWGIYMVKNHFFMSNAIDPAGFCISSMSGIISSDIRFDETMPLKEDYDFTLQHVKAFKKVARFNNVCIDALHYTNKGGCQDYRSDDRESEAVDILLGRYPTLIRLNPKRKNEIIIDIRKAK